MNKKQLVSFQLSEKELRALDALCKETDRSRSQVLRILVSMIDFPVVRRAIGESRKDPGRATQ